MADIDTVRLLIADTSTDETKRLFTDAQLASFLALNGGRVKKAAADALDAIAISEVLVSKKIRTQDLATDGPAVAAELRAQAKRLRDQDAEEDEENGDFAFFIAGGYPRGGRPELTEYDQSQYWGL